MKTSAVALAALMALSAASSAWTQQPTAPPIPQFPPGPDFAGVAGSAAENARITAICGPNRNAQDGYTTTPAFAGQTKAPIVKGTQGYAVESLARIDRPWSLAFLPDGKMLVSFRNGGVKTVTKDGKVSDPIAGAPQVNNPRLGSGMYDVILDRNFARNRVVYMTYHTKLDADKEAMGRVASAKLSADDRSFTDFKVLREGADIQPRRLVQANDGTLLVLSAGVTDSGTIHQDLTSQLGKVLRINTDGSIPKDNPFLKDPKANPAIWALGYRDIHSAVIHPKTGELWVAENTPKGGDELNVMRKGKNYGFPIISYGRMNSGALLNGGKTAQDGMEQPLYYWTPSIAPSGMAIYEGRALPGWKDSIFVGAMSGMQLVRLEMKGERVVGEEKLLLDRCQRIKDVREGPDGFLYILTDEMPPRQNEILRLVPAATAPAPRSAPAVPVAAAAPAASRPVASPQELSSAVTVYARFCSGCHGAEGGGGAGPAIAGRTDVANIAHVIEQGAGVMPAFSADRIGPADREAVARYLGTLKP